MLTLVLALIFIVSMFCGAWKTCFFAGVALFATDGLLIMGLLTALLGPQ